MTDADFLFCFWTRISADLTLIIYGFCGVMHYAPVNWIDIGNETTIDNNDGKGRGGPFLS